MKLRECIRSKRRAALVLLLLVLAAVLLFHSYVIPHHGGAGFGAKKLIRDARAHSLLDRLSVSRSALASKLSARAGHLRLQSPVNHSKLFQLPSRFHLPQPKFSRPDSVLIASEWNQHLKDFLSSVQGVPPQVSLVTASQEHQEVVLNWLISAVVTTHPPLRNILVLCLGREMYSHFKHRGIPSLFVSPEMVISPAANISRVFSQVHIVRMNVLRLMNGYGYDVVNYDSDAVLLRNPQEIFDQQMDADMIGTFGKGPARLFTKWGVTLNTGVLLFRANPRIEYYWEAMSRIMHPTTDDQGNVNLALEELNIEWANLRPHQNIDNIEYLLYGICRQKRVKIIVILLHFGVVCRHTCSPERREEYFVWHPLAIKENRTVVNKKLQARSGRAWFLHEDWEGMSAAAPEIKGANWLHHITDRQFLSRR